MYIHIYIYIERERERRICVYIYIYIERERCSHALMYILHIINNMLFNCLYVPGLGSLHARPAPTSSCTLHTGNATDPTQSHFGCEW